MAERILKGKETAQVVTTEDLRHSPEQRREMLSVAFKAANLELLNLVEELRSVVPDPNALMQAYRFAAERIGTVDAVNFESVLAHDDENGRYDVKNHQISLDMRHVSTAAECLETCVHELLHAGEVSVTSTNSFADSQDPLSNVREFLTSALPKHIKTFTPKQKRLVRESVTLILNQHGRTKHITIPPGEVDRFMEDESSLAAVLMPGVSLWHEIQIDTMAVQALNQIIKAREGSKLLQKTDFTPEYPPNLVKRMRSPFDLSKELGKFDGLRGYKKDHRAILWLRENFLPVSAQNDYAELERIARGYNFFAQEPIINIKKSEKLRGVLEQKFLEKIGRVGVARFVQIVLFLGALKVSQ